MKKRVKYSKVFWLVTYVLLVGFLLLNIKYVANVFQNIVNVFMPFIYGFILAYILSFPYNFFYNKCFVSIGKKKEKLKGLRKLVSIICAYIVCFGIVAFLIGILVPHLTESIRNLINDVPLYATVVVQKFDEFIIFVREQFGYDLYDADTYNEVISFITGTDLPQLIEEFIMNAFPAVINFAGNFTTALYNWIVGIFVSIYMLSTKDKLCYQLRAVVVAYLPLKASKKVLQITDLANKKCGKFIIGKIIDSLIIGVICFIGLSIFKFDYALLISVVVGITNIIPFFGPFIGAIPCALLLLLIDPLQCLWFIVFVVILQQFDGNVLGPKILGETVGISGFWILFSVIIGGGLFGLPGMLLGVPVFAVIYSLIDEGVTKRLKNKRDLLVAKAPAVEAETDTNTDTVENTNE